MTLPPRLRRLATGTGLGWALFALALIAAPWLSDSSLWRSAATQAGIALIACLSYNLLLGQGGMVSFGHAVYTGAGAFLAIHALNAAGLPVVLLPLAGGLAALALAAVLGWVTTRRGGTPFAMITLGVGELVAAGALMFPGVFGGEAGVSGNRSAGPALGGLRPDTPLQLYYLVAAHAGASALLLYGFTRTPLGRLLNAVRDNPERAAFTGHDPRQVRWLAFCIAAFFAGIAGGLSALNFEIVSAEAFGAHRSALLLLFTFLGGTGHFLGPVLGAVLMVGCFTLLSGLTRAWLLYVGLLFMLMVLRMPGGLAQGLEALWAAVRGGRLRGRAAAAAGLVAGAASAAAGLAGLVEMAYHLPLAPTLGPVARLGRLALDTSSSAAWTAGALLALAGTGLFVACRKRLAPMQRLQGVAADVIDTPAAAGPVEPVPTSRAVRLPAADAPAVLELRDLRLAFGRTEVLRGASLSLRPGERLALIGPNGAGKSTLFQVASGLLVPDAGQVLLQGRRIDGLPPFQACRLGLSRSFQVSSLFLRLSVADHLRCAVLWSLGHRYTALRPLSGLRDVEERVEELLSQLALAPVRDVEARQLAHAHQRALEIGLALAGQAPVVLLDEPTAGMNRAESRHCVDLVRRATEGRSLLMVEHDMEVVFDLADRVAVLVDGRVIALDTPERVRADPRVQEAYLGAAAATGLAQEALPC